ncbi:hypothetical protein ACJX0J_040051, partial [Zea mays]
SNFISSIYSLNQGKAQELGTNWALPMEAYNNCFGPRLIGIDAQDITAAPPVCILSLNCSSSAAGSITCLYMLDQGHT